MSKPEDSITLAQLREFCRDFDREQGPYPEHSLEGWTVLRYVEARWRGEETLSPDGWKEADRALAEFDRDVYGWKHPDAKEVT